MNKINKIISVFLVVIMLIGLIPTNILASGTSEDIIYKAQKLEVGLLNIQTMNNDAFKRAYVRTANDDFNLASKFIVESSNNIRGGAPYVLSYYSSFIHKGNGSGWYANYVWPYRSYDRPNNKYSTNYPTLVSLIQSGQIKSNITADLELDNHKNIPRHTSKKKDKARYALYQTAPHVNYTQSLTAERNADSDPDQSPVQYGYDKWCILDSGSAYTHFRLKLDNTTCECGSSRAQRISFSLADASYPYVYSIYTSSDINGTNVKDGFLKDEVGYINLRFNEPVRFSNNTVPSPGQYTLVFNLMNTDNNQEVTGHGVKADFVALQNNVMTFKFVTPATIGGSNTNHYIAGISNIQNWTNNIGDRSYDLKLLGANGTPISLSGVLAQDTELTKTSSLISDLAGNPINWGRSVKSLSKFAYLDNVAPVVKSVELAGNMINEDSVKYSQASEWPKDIDRSAVFAGVGDRVVFSANFSEELKLGSNTIDTIKATINANDGVIPVVLTANRIDTVKDGVNGINISKITFNEITITDAMVPTGEKSPLVITDITVPNGVSDLRGNVVNNIVVNSKPKQQEWLDTLSSNVSSSVMADSNNKFTPIYYNQNNKNEFYFPINVVDDDARGIDYASNSNGAIGKFAWVDNSNNQNKISYPFEYYVSATTNKPNTYMQGNTSISESAQNSYDFIQVENGNYIHIKLLDNVEYNLNNPKLIINGGDYAGNLNKTDFELNYVADRVKPLGQEAGYCTSFNSIDKEGLFNVKIKISDTCGVDPSNIYYQWVGKGENFENNNWLSYIGSTIGNPPTDYIISIIKSSLQYEMLHEFDLYVKIIDKSDNEKIEKFSYMYDLRKAACNIDIKTDKNEPVAHPLISLSSPSGNVLTSGGDETPATSLFMVKNPDTDSQYYIREISSNSKENVADILSDEDIYSWYLANVTESGNGFDFVNGRKLNYYNPQSSERKRFEELCNNYYGVLDFIVITGYGEVPSPFNLIPQSEITTEKTIDDIESSYDSNSTFLFKIDGVNVSYRHKRTIVGGILDSSECYYFSGSTTSSAIIYNVDGVTEAYGLLPLSRVEGNISVDRFSVKSASMPKSLAGKQLHYIDIKPALMPDGTAVSITNSNVPEGTPNGIGYRDSEYVPGGEPRFLSSLDGIQIPFTISNSLIPSWGVDDVDFDSPDTYVALYYTRDQKYYYESGREEICKMPLNPNSTEQLFIIPEGKATKTGFYSFEVSVKSKDKGSIYNTEIVKKENSRIFLNAESTQDMFGFFGAVGNSYYENDVRRFYLNDFNKIESEYNYTSSFNIGTLQSPNTGTDWTLYFGRDKHNSGYNDKYIGQYNTGFNTIYIYDHAYFKVWNNADPNGYNNAPWGTVIGNVDVVFVDSANDITAAMYQNSGEYTAPHVPVVRGVENTICYQMILQNGEVSPIRQITINTSNISPSLQVAFSPEKPIDGSLVSEVSASVQSVFSPNGVSKIGCIDISPRDEGEMEGDSSKYREGGYLEFEDNACKLTHNGEYMLYIVDNCGNVGMVNKTIDYIDSSYPIVSVVDNNSLGNEFNATITIEDNYDIDGGEVYLTYDSAYSVVLNRDEQATENDSAQVTVKVPYNTKGGEWYATSPAKDGIYYTNTTLSPDKKTKTVEIKGIFKFDTQTAEAATVERTLSFSASDKAGAVSPIYEEVYDWNTDSYRTELMYGSYIVLSNSKNIAPKYVDSKLTIDNKIKLKFNTPVLIDKPTDTSTNIKYLSEISTLPIYSDGTYSISYVDLFGKKYDEDINLTPYGDFDISVNISNEEPTNTDVIVSIDATAKNGLTIENIEGTLADDIKIDSTNKTAIVTLKQNADLIVTLKKDNKTVTRTIVISNIDKDAPIVEPYIYYTAGKPLAGETTTDGEVVAGVICNEDLVGLNGPLTYTFKFGGPTSYTFEYADLAGNKGVLKIDLPCTINEPKIVDTTKPIYSMDVYVKTNNTMNQSEGFMSWSGNSINDLVSSLPNAQAYLFSFIPQDESQVKLIVKNGTPSSAPSYSDNSDIIDGLVAGDRSILIEKNINCTVFLVDSSGNYESIPFNVTKTDNIAPNAEIIYVPSTFYSIRAYLREIGIKDPSGFIVANVLGVVQDNGGGENNGLYYHDFKENSDFIFYYKDGVGNSNQLMASVSGIDNSPASVTQVKWSPINPSYAGFVTNKDITAQIQFNKPVKDVTLEWVNDTDKSKNINDYVSLGIASSYSILTFKQNTPPVRVKFKALNDKEGIYELQSVNCIDKSVPNVTVGSISLSQDKKTASLTFTSDKDVSFAEGLRPNVFDTNFSKSVTENGTYVFSFTDKAGNCVKVSVDITTIDNIKLALSFNTSASDIGATSMANKLDVKIGDSFFVKMNKPGTIIFNSSSYNVSANAWTKILVTQAVDNLIYVLKATDETGESVYAYLNIAPVDKVSPTIILKNEIVSVPENTDNASLESAIKANVILSDDVSLLANIVLVFDATTVDTLTKGIYTIIYKATDESGNLTEKNGYVRIYGKDEINVLVNGEKTSFGSTIVIDKGSIKLDISNLNNEPYTVYYKSGIKTEGQMKIGSTIVANKSLELTNNGFYTIYIVTQTRRSYITYIYIEQ